MKFHSRSLLALGGALIFATGLASAQAAKQAAPPSKQAAPPATSQPAARKLVSPVRGEAPIEYTAPQTKRQGSDFIITTFKVKNVATAPLAGFKVDEFWYDQAGNPVGGAPTFRHRTPIQPGEVITVELKTAVNPAMNRPQWKFEHANGAIKPTRVPKL
jgi:hypothetical protein